MATQDILRVTLDPGEVLKVSIFFITQLQAPEKAENLEMAL